MKRNAYEKTDGGSTFQRPCRPIHDAYGCVVGASTIAETSHYCVRGEEQCASARRSLRNTYLVAQDLAGTLVDGRNPAACSKTPCVRRGFNYAIRAIFAPVASRHFFAAAPEPRSSAELEELWQRLGEEFGPVRRAVSQSLVRGKVWTEVPEFNFAWRCRHAPFDGRLTARRGSQRSRCVDAVRRQVRTFGAEDTQYLHALIAPNRLAIENSRSMTQRCRPMANYAGRSTSANGRSAR
jgi:hypothetical protein